MARTRQLHPEFFKHEDLGALSPLHRLLFQGMWCEADREGRLEDRPKRLRATWLPYDDADGDKLVDDLVARKHVVRYEVGGLKLLLIPSFKRWQKVHPSEVESKLPGPTTDSGRSENSLHVDLKPTPGGVGNLPLPSLPSQSSLPTSDLQQPVAASPPTPPPESRLTGKDLRERWNASLVDGSKRPPWEEFSAAQELQADRAALEFDRGKWDRFFAVLRVSAFLNGFGAKGWALTPRKLLAEPRRWVEAALNGEYSGPGDMREPEQEPEPAAVMCREHPDRRAVNPVAAVPQCGDCAFADLRPRPA